MHCPESAASQRWPQCPSAPLFAAAGGLGLKTAANMETARIGFETMLGSAQKADKFLRELQAFAAKTPFEFPELQTAASSLISIGIDASKVIPIMTTLGNVTSGMGTGSEGVKRATVALQQMNAAGRITAEDLNQLRDAGIPVFDLLAGATGKTKEELAGMAQNGKLGRKELEQLMAALESGKGLERFNGLMEKQSQSLSGLFSTLKDTVQLNLAEAVQPLVPAIKAAMDGAAPIMDAGLAAFAAKSKVLVEQVPNLVGAIADQDAQGIGEVLDNIFGNTGDKVAIFRAAAEQLLPVIAQAREVFQNLWSIATQLGPILGAGLGGSARLVWETFKLLLPVLVQITGFLNQHKGAVIALAAGYGVLRAAMLAHTVAMKAQEAGGLLQFIGKWISSMKIAAGIQKAWTAVQWLFNAAMNANPIVKIIGIIALIVGALITAYQTSDTFRGIVQGAFKAVGDAAGWLWNNVLSPVWSALKVAWDAVATGIQWAWENILQPVFTVLGKVAQGLAIFLMVVVFGPLMLAWKALTVAMEWAWENILKPVWDAISTAAQLLWNNVLQPVFAIIGLQWQLLMTALQWAWDNILKPVWDAITVAAQWLWSNILLPIFTAIGLEWRALMAGLDWAWENILKPVWDGVAAAAGWLWRTILQPIFSAIGTAWSALFDGMKWAWTNILSPVFDWFGRAVETIKNSFTTAVDWIGRVWDGMKSKLMTPVQWVVDFVWNNGLRKLWNWINNLWGGDDLEAFRLDAATGAVVPQNLGRAHAYATGGVLPGYTPGRDVHRFFSPTGGILNLSGGEAIMRPEFTRALGAGGIEELNKAARTGGVNGVATALGISQSHADGGIINLPGWLDSVISVIPGHGVVTDVIDAINGGKGFGKGHWATMLTGMVKQVGSKVWDKVKSLLGTSAAPGAGAGAERWRGVVAQVVAMLGVTPDAINGILHMIQMESGGNPSAVNLWDSNAKAGHPSQGLMQTIPSTFAAHAGPFTGRGILDPLANIYAGVNYALRRYGVGMLISGGRRSGGGGYLGYALGGVLPKLYDSGGILGHGDLGINLSGKPEAVLTNDEFATLRKIAKGGGGDAPLIGGDLVLQVGEGASVRDQMEEAMFQLRRIKRGGALR
ncbi:tape measure protein [Amycolatopsis sp. PS_44_ISF1]|uniref:tape measure protein n=1 Tax=Amycolatopsis sp. PS_44_ISF1 TaxID=2974917 RepID=UPI0028DE7B1F|nr:tape measure protein [Amycolatopsis sp. PS_44_ISF1]MDT8916293.1 tape measure protein [Amycolatopsis sp. PS_44_ISF1]MDT8916304.1 tape measure protein [Amycolatopsis sp. PS_44_ISF1]